MMPLSATMKRTVLLLILSGYVLQVCQAGGSSASKSSGEGSSAKQTTMKTSSVDKFWQMKTFGSLILVINRGSSMSQELKQLESKIVEMEKSKGRFSSIVLALYGGGKKQIVAKFPAEKGKLKIGKFAKSSFASVRGGGSCPQESMSAMAEAIIAADPNSVLLHITDASPSDSNRKAFVICLSKYRNVRIFTVAIGALCGKAYRSEFEFLAKRTNGAVIRIRKDSFMQLLEYVIRAETEVILFSKIAEFKKKTKQCTKTSLKCRCGSRKTVNLIQSTKTQTAAKIKNGKASLGIVLDTTGSMQPEYKAIRQQIASLIKSTSKLFAKVAIGEYNDPYKRRMVVTTKPREALDFLEETWVFAGGDCPEPSYHALRDMATALTPGSVIFLFTDASANDQKLQGPVERLLRSKEIVLNVVSTGDMCKSEGQFNNKLQLTAAASGGRQLKMRKSLVKDMMRYIRKISRYGIGLVRNIPKSVTEISALAKGCKCESKTEC